MSGLRISGLTKRFQGIVAVDDVDLEIGQGEIVGLIGPNGSGKTTLFNCITGYMNPDGGRVRKGDVDLTRAPPHRVALAGVARTFQTTRIFADLTGLGNLLVAAQQPQRDSLLGCLLRTRSTRVKEASAVQQADEALEFVGLGKFRDVPAGTLSYGQRKLLAFATALVLDPEIILLDEPAAAVNPTMINRMRDRILELNKRGVSFLIVEHNMDFIMGVADRIAVLDRGEKIAEGDPRSIQADEGVLEAYFGR